MPPKVIVFSSLFPSPWSPLNGLFVSELTISLSQISELTVLAPVIAHRHLKQFWRIPRNYSLSSRVKVWTPIVFNFPKIFKSTDGALMAACSHSAFEQAAGEYADIVHAHYAYPDAVAAWKLAKKHDLPLVVTVHGSDINVLAGESNRNYQIVQMLKGAAAIVCVAKDLVRKVVALGVSESRVHHIPNGVDTHKFTPGDKLFHRAVLGLNHHNKLLLAVGHLIPIKGYDRLIEAMVNTHPDTGLVIVGEGSERSYLGRRAKQMGLGHRVHFAGPIAHDELAAYYRASDFLVISSHSEGWPTVIFEALACGLPVIGNNVGGIPEVISSSEIGLLTKDNNPQTIAAAIATAYEREWDQGKAVSVAEKNTWDKIAEQYLQIYQDIKAKQSYIISSAEKF